MPPPATAWRNCRRPDAIVPADGGFSPVLEKLVAAFGRTEGAGRCRGWYSRDTSRQSVIVDMGMGAMKILRLAVTAAALLLSFEATVQAQTTLRIGLAEDPDILDPTLARTYVGRIVFASLCDKLFDIDEKLNIVPQLALSHETSADGKEVTIKLRPGVKFHDGEPFDAEAAKFSLDRHLTMPTSFRKPELAAARPCRRRRSPHHQAGVEDAVLAADRPAHRPRRHDGVAEGREGGRRQVRTEAGLRRSLQIRRTRAAGPHRVREIRRLLEQGQGQDRPHRLSADGRRHGSPRQSEIRRSRSDRAAARHRHQGGAVGSQTETVDRDRARLSGRDAERRQGQGQGTAQPVRQGASGARSLDRPRGHQPGGVQRRIQARQPVGQSRSSLLPEGLPGPRRATSPRPRRC